MARRTGLMFHELFMWHEHGKRSGLMPGVYPVQPGQPYENPETKRRIKNLLDACGMTERLVPVKARAATDAELRRVHTEAYLARLAAGNEEPEAVAGFDAVYTRGSFDIARLSAGGCIAAAEAVVAGRVDNAYALARPIGHHAEPDEGKGFCMLNNGALAAMYVIETGGIDRVAFVDIDVHHGNGAQKIFWRDPRALTISIHQDRWFPPDSGGVDEIGEGPGRNYSLNIPLPAGCGFGAYRAAFERVVLPALDAFGPRMIFVPCGYDAGAQDPLGRMILGSNHFRQLAAMLALAADRHAGGRLLCTHEGGYNESTVPFMALAVIEAISGIDSGVVDPYGEIFDMMHGHELLPHQDEAIGRAERQLAALKATITTDRGAA